MDNLFETVAYATQALRLDLTSEEFAVFADNNNLTESEIMAIAKTFSYLSQKKKQTTIEMLLKTSRLPRKVPKTFENFDFSLIKGRDVDRLKSLSSLSAIYAHQNLAFIGDTKWL